MYVHSDTLDRAVPPESTASEGCELGAPPRGAGHAGVGCRAYLGGGLRSGRCRARQRHFGPHPQASAGEKRERGETGSEKTKNGEETEGAREGETGREREIKFRNTYLLGTLEL